MDFREIIVSFIESDSFKTILSVILTAFLTYFVTRKTEDKKQNINIKVIQLEKIYLPLYSLLYNKKSNEIEIETLYKNMLTKKQKYFLYLTDTYLFHLKNIERDINKGNISNVTIKKCKMYINYEYGKLKKECGYPYKSDFRNSYFCFYLIKLIFALLNVTLAFIFSAFFLFGEILYNEYENIGNVLVNVLALIMIFDIFVFLLYVVYKIYLYEYIHTNVNW